VNFWINAIAYQATWLVAIGGAAHGWWWPGPAIAVLFAAWQLSVSTCRRADLLLIACAVVIGFALDSAFAMHGLIRYGMPVPWPQLAPVWIVALWLSFALTLNHSLNYLKAHLAFAALFGGIGAPLAYLAAERMGALEFAEPATNTLAILAAAWALLAPALCLLASRLDPLKPAPVLLRGLSR
jgi:Protein of unknown function (DUF2878)